MWVPFRRQRQHPSWRAVTNCCVGCASLVDFSRTSQNACLVCPPLMFCVLFQALLPPVLPPIMRPYRFVVATAGDTFTTGAAAPPLDTCLGPMRSLPTGLSIVQKAGCHGHIQFGFSDPTQLGLLLASVVNVNLTWEEKKPNTSPVILSAINEIKRHPLFSLRRTYNDKVEPAAWCGIAACYVTGYCCCRLEYVHFPSNEVSPNIVNRVSRFRSSAQISLAVVYLIGQRQLFTHGVCSQLPPVVWAILFGAMTDSSGLCPETKFYPQMVRHSFMIKMHRHQCVTSQHTGTECVGTPAFSRGHWYADCIYSV